jgi:hypothetical protein
VGLSLFFVLGVIVFAVLLDSIEVKFDSFVVPTSSSTGTTPLVQGGQIVENNAAALGGLGYIRIATPSTSSQQESKVQQQLV